MQTLLRCQQTRWFQSEIRKRAHSSCTFTVSPCIDSVIALSSMSKWYILVLFMLILHISAAFVTIILLCLPSCYSQWVSDQLIRKDTSKNCLDIGHPSPPCPHLVSDLSLAPLLISQGIKSHSPSVFVLPTHCHGLRTLHPFSKQRSEAQMLTR